MLTPDYLAGVAEPLQAIYAELQTEIEADIARRIRKAGGIKVTDTAAWQVEKLKQLGASQQYIREQIAAKTGLGTAELARLFKAAGIKSLDADETTRAAAAAAGIATRSMPLTVTPALAQVLQANLTRTAGTLQRLTGTLAVDATGKLNKYLDRAQLLTQSGAYTAQQSIDKAVEAFAADGVQVFDYESGVRTTVDAAVRRAVITGINQATGKVSENNAALLGTDLVEVTSHADARPEHATWQGKVYSLSGSHPKYPSLKEGTGYGTGAGLCGWNCRHSFYAFIEGVSEKLPKPAYNETTYQAEQKQRYQERMIRAWKRRVNTLEAGGADATAAKKRVAFWQTKQREHVAKFDLARMYNREKVYGMKALPARPKVSAAELARREAEKKAEATRAASRERTRKWREAKKAAAAAPPVPPPPPTLEELARAKAEATKAATRERTRKWREGKAAAAAAKAPVIPAETKVAKAKESAERAAREKAAKEAKLREAAAKKKAAEEARIKKAEEKARDFAEKEHARTERIRLEEAKAARKKAEDEAEKKRLADAAARADKLKRETAERIKAMEAESAARKKAALDAAQKALADKKAQLGSPQRLKNGVKPATLQNFEKRSDELLAKMPGHNPKDATGIAEQNAIKNFFKERMDKGVVRSRIDQGTMEHVIKDGKLKTQIELDFEARQGTGAPPARSGGMLDPRERADASEEMFGTNRRTISPRDYEFYGYIADEDLVTDFAGENALSSYGSSTLQFKPEIRKLTTFTTGDSLGSGLVPSYLDEITPSWDSGRWSRSELLTHAKKRTPTIAKLVGEAQCNYLEAQLHGGVTIDDVESFIIGPKDFKRSGINKKVCEALDKKGIKIGLLEETGGRDKYVFRWLERGKDFAEDKTKEIVWGGHIPSAAIRQDSELAKYWGISVPEAQEARSTIAKYTEFVSDAKKIRAAAILDADQLKTATAQQLKARAAADRLEKIIENGPSFKGELHRGLIVKNDELQAYTKVGSIIDTRGMTSWTSNVETAESFARIETAKFNAFGKQVGELSTANKNSVVLIGKDFKYSTSIDEIGGFKMEEVLVSKKVNFEVTKVTQGSGRNKGTVYLYVKEVLR